MSKSFECLPGDEALRHAIASKDTIFVTGVDPNMDGIPEIADENSFLLQTWVIAPILHVRERSRKLNSSHPGLRLAESLLWELADREAPFVTQYNLDRQRLNVWGNIRNYEPSRIEYVVYDFAVKTSRTEISWDSNSSFAQNPVDPEETVEVLPLLRRIVAVPEPAIAEAYVKSGQQSAMDRISDTRRGIDYFRESYPNPITQINLNGTRFD